MSALPAPTLTDFEALTDQWDRTRDAIERVLVAQPSNMTAAAEALALQRTAMQQALQTLLRRIQ